jgi:transposase
MRLKGSAAELEARRRRAAKLLATGKSQREVARLVGASPTSVNRWKAALDARGEAGILSKPHPGRRPRLGAAEKKRLVRILDRGASAAGFDTDLWTCSRVGHVVLREFGVAYHVDHVWKLLRSLGFTSQRPQKLARERDEQVIKRWQRRDWPRIKKRRGAARR